MIDTAICDACENCDQPTQCRQDQRPERLSLETECSWWADYRRSWLNSDECRQEIELGY